MQQRQTLTKGSPLRKLKHRSVRRGALVIGQHLDVAALSASWLARWSGQITDRANSDMDDAPRGISYEARTRGGDAGSSTELAALASPDEIAAHAHRLAEHMAAGARFARLAMLELQAAERCGRWLLPMDRENARKLAEAEEVQLDETDETRSAQCANPNCRRIVARTPNDRLRGGRCNACRMYLDRNDHERPAHLCALSGDIDDVLSVDGLGLDQSRLITQD